MNLAIMFRKFGFRGLNIVSNLTPIKYSQPRLASTFCLKGIHEPEYLEYLKPQIPFYNLINIQVCFCCCCKFRPFLTLYFSKDKSS